MVCAPCLSPAYMQIDLKLSRTNDWNIFTYQITCFPLLRPSRTGGKVKDTAFEAQLIIFFIGKFLGHEN